MKRAIAIVIVALVLWPGPVRAQEAEPAPASSEQAAAGSEASDLLMPTPEEWRLKYADARAKLVTGEFADAAARFAELERTAANRFDRSLARAQGSLSAEWARRGLAFVQRSDLGESNASARSVDKRTTDELVSLYTNAVFYGLGSGAWLATLTDPKGAAGAILPAIGLTGASVGAVIALDSGRGFRYGVPQSIVSGLYIGLEHGIVWGVWAANRRDSQWTAKGEATFIWTLSSLGAVGGGVLGATLGTTPGRSSWVGSTALWSGVLLGFATGAVAKDDNDRPLESALAAGGVGLSAGTIAGVATAHLVSPSIARVRFIDLGGLSGGLLAAGIYASAANEKVDGQVASGVTALGVASGLVAGWFLTSSIAADRPAQKAGAGEGASAAPPTTPRRTALERMQPLLMPANGGALVGIGGSLD